jgi:hypothetical protein
MDSIRGVLGEINREYCQRNYVYEGVIVASLDYAIKNNIERIHYSLIDNYTKLRLIDSLEPCDRQISSRAGHLRKSKGAFCTSGAKKAFCSNVR